MKLGHFVWIGVATVAVTTAPISVQALARLTMPAAVAASMQAQMQSQMQSQTPQTTAIAMGTFVAAEQPTVGTARIVQEAGQRYLELDRGFSTSSQGPDLHVLLDKATQAPASYGAQNQTVNLGRLQNYSGAQRYAIPDDVDVSQYHSVVIWCQMANATFGYAPLNSNV